MIINHAHTTYTKQLTNNTKQTDKTKRNRKKETNTKQREREREREGERERGRETGTAFVVIYVNDSVTFISQLVHTKKKP